jgi:hypothetical protein
MYLAKNDDLILVSEWAPESFHRKVSELEAQGYLARRESYNVTPEMNPETGIIIHMHTLEMLKPESGVRRSSNDG